MARAQTPVSQQTQPVPEARGRAEAISTLLASGGLRKGGRYTKGKIKGMTINEATARGKALWEAAPTAIKEKYASRANGGLAPSEEAEYRRQQQQYEQDRARGRTGPDPTQTRRMTDTPESYQEEDPNAQDEAGGAGGAGETDPTAFFKAENSKAESQYAQRQRQNQMGAGLASNNQPAPTQTRRVVNPNSRPVVQTRANKDIPNADNARAQAQISQETGGQMYGQTAFSPAQASGMIGMTGEVRSTDNPRNPALVKTPPSSTSPADLRMAEDQRAMQSRAVADAGASMGAASGTVAGTPGPAPTPRRMAPTPAAPATPPPADSVAQAQKDYGLASGQALGSAPDDSYTWTGYKGGKKLFEQGVDKPRVATPDEQAAAGREMAKAGIPGTSQFLPKATPQLAAPATRRMTDDRPDESYTPGIGLVPKAQPVTGPDAVISREQYDQAGSRMRTVGGNSKQDSQDASLRSEYERQRMGYSASGLPSRVRRMN